MNTPDPLAALSSLYVAVVADVLDRMGYRDQVMSHHVRPLEGLVQGPIVGRAHTVKCVEDAIIDDNPYEHEIAAVDSLNEGDVIVLDTGKALDVAIWGELLATRAKSRGCVGAILDGGVRDVGGLLDLGIPTFAGSISANDSRGRVRVIGHSQPITCAGVSVNEGDVIFADVDGVVVIPAQLLDEVVEVASRKVERENQSKEALAAGASASETYERYQVL